MNCVNDLLAWEEPSQVAARSRSWCTDLGEASSLRWAPCQQDPGEHHYDRDARESAGRRSREQHQAFQE